MHIYLEKTLQLAAVAWMRRQWGYEELASDEEATGERMDSIGLLQGAPIAIEVKHKVSHGMIRYRVDRSGSIEAKIAATLRGLYLSEEGKQADLLRRHWDASKPLQVCVLAGQYSKAALAELSDLLEERSATWIFTGRILLWDGKRVEELFESSTPLAPSDWHRIEIPQLIGQQKRSRPPTLDQLSDRAAESGLREAFDALLSAARAAGLKVKPTANGLSFSRPRETGAVMGCYLGRSDPSLGLNLGIDVEGLDIAVTMVPGAEAPRAGFFNFNRYLREGPLLETVCEMVARATRPQSRSKV